MAFYTFSQNNSGGTWELGDLITYWVIVEADSAQEANNRAQDLGIYFNGVAAGIDCECCGDRWWPEYNDGDPEPNIFGTAPEEYHDWHAKPTEVYCRVFYEDGLIKEYRKKAPFDDHPAHSTIRRLT